MFYGRFLDSKQRNGMKWPNLVERRWWPVWGGFFFLAQTTLSCSYPLENQTWQWEMVGNPLKNGGFDGRSSMEDFPARHVWLPEGIFHSILNTPHSHGESTIFPVWIHHFLVQKLQGCCPRGQRGAWWGAMLRCWWSPNIWNSRIWWWYGDYIVIIWWL